MLRVLELFSGIGACSKALENLGISHEIVDSVEIDKYAVASFNSIHGTNFEPQDITKWDKDIDVDLIMHGSPCQDFSVAGKQAGGDAGSGTRSSLMYETLRIVEKLKPNYVIWENVKNLLSKKHRHNFDAYLESMESLGYVNYYKVLNAADYGVPQHRERVFTISILNGEKDFVFPDPIPLDKKLNDILEDNVDEKYYLTDKQVARIENSNFNQEKTRIQDNDISQTILSRDYKDPKCVRVGGLYDHNGKKHQAGSIYDTDGLAPTLSTMQGGNQEPIIVDNNKSQNLKTKLCNKLVKEGIVHGGEIVNHSYTTSEQRDTLEKYIETRNGLTPTLTTRPDILGVVVGDNARYNMDNDVRIRKLTPKECWRLMGFDDESFNKAEKNNSNAQLYKQAGNSICVNVLEHILKNLLVE